MLVRRPARPLMVALALLLALYVVAGPAPRHAQSQAQENCPPTSPGCPGSSSPSSPSPASPASPPSTSPKPPQARAAAEQANRKANLLQAEINGLRAQLQNAGGTGGDDDIPSPEEM